MPGDGNAEDARGFSSSGYLCSLRASESTSSTVSKFRIFVSSVQKELTVERRALQEHVHRDPLLRQFFEVFLFEDLPASGRRADAVYLAEVDGCDVYVGGLWRSIRI